MEKGNCCAGRVPLRSMYHRILFDSSTLWAVSFVAPPGCVLVLLGYILLSVDEWRASKRSGAVYVFLNACTV